MRVIAGRFGGRRLESPPRASRPTSDRVREALFSTLGPLEDLSVIDLFAGSGALAIEALSRGAASAVLVEKDRGAAAAVAANLESLGVAGEATLVRGDAVAEARRLAGEGEAFDLVFLDPPYAEAQAVLSHLEELLPGLLAPGGRIVLECDRRDPPALDLPMVHERRYGDTVIRIHSSRE